MCSKAAFFPHILLCFNKLVLYHMCLKRRSSGQEIVLFGYEYGSRFDVNADDEIGRIRDDYMKGARLQHSPGNAVHPQFLRLHNAHRIFEPKWYRARDGRKWIHRKLGFVLHDIYGLITSQGSYVAERLRSMGYHVRIVDISPKSYFAHPAPMEELVGDLCDIAVCRRAVNDVNTVLHFAAVMVLCFLHAQGH